MVRTSSASRAGGRSVRPTTEEALFRVQPSRWQRATTRELGRRSRWCEHHSVQKRIQAKAGQRARGEEPK